MADYQATANSIFDPQLQAEEGSVNSERDSNLQALSDEQRQVNPYYDSAEKTLKTTRASEGQQADFNYNEAGIYESGLRQNSQNALGQDLIDKTKDLEQERADKLLSISERSTLAKDKASSAISGLVAKYQGMKNQWISDSQQKDAALNEQIREFNSSQALAQQQMASSERIAASYGGGSTAAAHTPYDTIAKTLESMAGSGTKWGDAANFLKGQGIDPSTFDQALKRIYGQKEGNMKKYGYNVNAEVLAKKNYGG